METDQNNLMNELYDMKILSMYFANMIRKKYYTKSKGKLTLGTKGSFLVGGEVANRNPLLGVRSHQFS